MAGGALLVPEEGCGRRGGGGGAVGGARACVGGGCGKGAGADRATHEVCVGDSRDAVVGFLGRRFVLFFPRPPGSLRSFLLCALVATPSPLPCSPRRPLLSPLCSLSALLFVTLVSSLSSPARAQVFDDPIPGINNVFGHHRKVTKRWYFWFSIAIIALSIVSSVSFIYRGFRKYRRYCALELLELRLALELTTAEERQQAAARARPKAAGWRLADGDVDEAFAREVARRTAATDRLKPIELGVCRAKSAFF